jgi:hypothetical protein
MKIISENNFSSRAKENFHNAFTSFISSPSPKSSCSYFPRCTFEYKQAEPNTKIKSTMEQFRIKEEPAATLQVEELNTEILSTMGQLPIKEEPVATLQVEEPNTKRKLATEEQDPVKLEVIKPDVIKILGLLSFCPLHSQPALQFQFFFTR